MNPAAIYKQATGKVSEEAKEQIVKQKVELATEQQKEKISIASWLTHPVTKTFFAELETQISKLDNEARELALNYHLTQNHQTIVTTLIKSATLRKLKEDTHEKATTATA